MDRGMAQENSNKLEALIENQSAWKLIQLSYIIDDITTFMSQHNTCPVIPSGSTAEGFLFDGANDADHMVCVDDIIATEECATQDEAIQYVKLVLSKHPGHYHLETNPQNATAETKDTFVKTDGRWYMSGLKFKDHCKSIKIFTKYQVPGSSMEESGPATKFTLNDWINSDDWVYCIAINAWPIEVLNSFFTRAGIYSWLTQSTIRKIQSMKCYLVAKAHTTSTDKDGDITEFRLSFSVIEKYLIRHWTKKQFMVYYIIKFLKRHDNFPKVIESYFVKTTLFWMCENQPDSFWSQPLLTKVDQCLQELQDCLQERVLRNYFIPENNMITKYTQVECNLAADALIDIRKNLFRNIKKNLSILIRDDSTIESLFIKEHPEHLNYNEDKAHPVDPITTLFLVYLVNRSKWFQIINNGAIKKNITYFDKLKDLHSFRDDPLEKIDVSVEIQHFYVNFSNICIGNIYIELARRQLARLQDKMLLRHSEEQSKTHGIAYALGLLLACSYYYTNVVAAHKSQNKMLLIQSLGRLALCLFVTNNHQATEYYINKYLDLTELPKYPASVYLDSLPTHNIDDKGLHDLLVVKRGTGYYTNTSSYVLIVYIHYV